MKLVRFGTRGQEKPGIVTADGRIKDVSAHVHDYDHAFFASGGLVPLRGIAANPDSLPDAPAGVRIGVPVARPRSVFAIGLVIGRDARYLPSTASAASEACASRRERCSRRRRHPDQTSHGRWEK